MKKGGLKAILESAGLAEFSDEDNKPKVEQKKVQPVTQARSAPVESAPVFQVPTPPMSSPSTVTSEDLQRFIAHFDDLLKKTNLPGPDYYEFAQVLESQAMSQFDEKTRIAASFASLVAQGLTKDRLISSASQYITVIQKDKDGFEGALKTKLQNEVNSRQTQIAKAQESIEQKTQQIQAITKSITEDQASIAKLNNEIAESSAVIQKNEGAYLTACDSFILKIQSNTNKIQQYL
jgi:hypothetical protein